MVDVMTQTWKVDNACDDGLSFVRHWLRRGIPVAMASTGPGTATGHHN